MTCRRLHLPQRALRKKEGEDRISVSVQASLSESVTAGICELGFNHVWVPCGGRAEGSGVTCGLKKGA